MKHPRLAFLVNGDRASAMGIRARSFEQRLRSDFDIHIAYRSSNKIWAIFQFVVFLLHFRPAICYVFDMGFSGIIAAAIYRTLMARKTVVDTGDAIYELSQSSGNRGPIGLWLTKLLERLALAIADRVVVRSHPHQELLELRGIEATVVPDGVDMDQFCPIPSERVRQKYDLNGFVVIGLLGSLIWNSRWQMCYGTELIETLRRVRDLPVKGVIIGDGSGLPELKKRCQAAGLEDRILFLGRIGYDDLPAHINSMDLCLSTQTNDAAGQVRTTGKLPLYLACGRFVLASRVGEAARVLPPEMLVDYYGIKDDSYPERLAERVRELWRNPEIWRDRGVGLSIARRNFDYNLLAHRLRETLYGLLPASSGVAANNVPTDAGVAKEAGAANEPGSR